MDLFEIYNSFKTERDCQFYLINLRWPDGVVCVYCESGQVYKRSNGKRFKCRCCNKSFSVTAQTIFHSTKLPLSKWFLAVAQILSAKKGISSLQLARTIKVDKNTAWYMQMRIRAAMNSDILLNGITDVGMKNEKTEKSTPGDNQVITLCVSENVESHKSINSKESVTFEQSKFCQARKKKFIGIRHYYARGNGFKRKVLNQSERNRTNEWTFERIRNDGYFSMLKRAVIGQYHRLSNFHLQSYVQEIAFKKNYQDIKAFDLLMIRACAVW